MCFLKGRSLLSTCGQYYFFRISHRLRVICVLCLQWDFPISGAVLPLLGPWPHNYESVARKPQKGTCTNGITPEGREKFVLTSNEDECQKKDNNDSDNKSIRNDKNLLGYFSPSWGPSQLGYRMKLWEFPKIPVLITSAKRHLDRTHTYGFTRRSYLAYFCALAIRP